MRGAFGDFVNSWDSGRFELVRGFSGCLARGALASHPERSDEGAQSKDPVEVTSDVD